MALTPEQRDRALEQHRKSLDEVDDALLAALAKRAAISRQIAALRADVQQPKGWSPRRDREVLERLEHAGAGDFPKRAIAPLFREVLAACTSIEAPIRVAYEGPPGSICHESARKRFGAASEYLPCEGARAAIALVEREHADVAVVVLESSHEGLLQPSLDAIFDAELKIVDEVEIDSKIHLLNRTGNVSDVEKVYAAPFERAAAARFLATNLPRAAVLDTRTPAMAAQLAAEDHGSASLGGSVLAEMFDLEIARGNVADETGEHVRAAVLSPRPAPRTGHDATAIVLTVDDAPGALFRVLKPLAEKDLNLKRIQSRPRASGESEGRSSYRFFFEVAGHVTDRPLVAALEEVKRSVRSLKILGSYPSVR